MTNTSHISFDAQTQHVALRRDLKARRAYVSAYTEYLKKLAAERDQSLGSANAWRK